MRRRLFSRMKHRRNHRLFSSRSLVLHQRSVELGRKYLAKRGQFRGEALERARERGREYINNLRVENRRREIPPYPDFDSSHPHGSAEELAAIADFLKRVEEWIGRYATHESP